MLMEPQEESLCCEADCLWQAGQVWKLLHTPCCWDPARAQAGAREGSGALWNHPSWLQQPLWAMGAAARGKGVPYFFSFPSPPAIPVRCSFPGNCSLLRNLLMAEPKEITSLITDRAHLSQDSPRQPQAGAYLPLPLVPTAKPRLSVDLS